MKNTLLSLSIILASLIFVSCADKPVNLSSENLEVINREIISAEENELVMNNEESDGLAILKDHKFESGTIELEIRGEDVQGKSFVGVAFNIQNDSTYEAIYFRPFNFRATEQIRKEHAMQYINHPKSTWHYLRNNHEGVYEAEFPNPPDPNDWFGVSIKIDTETVRVFDSRSHTQLLNVSRIDKPVSDVIGLWMGFDSKGSYRNVRLVD